VRPVWFGGLVGGRAGDQRVWEQQHARSDGRALVPQVHAIQAAEEGFQPASAGREQQGPAVEVDGQDAGQFAPEVAVLNPARAHVDPQSDQRGGAEADGELSDVAAFEPGVHRAAQDPDPVEDCGEDRHRVHNLSRVLVVPYFGRLHFGLATDRRRFAVLWS
jgi:hypothetical protein